MLRAFKYESYTRNIRLGFTEQKNWRQIWRTD